MHGRDPGRQHVLREGLDRAHPKVHPRGRGRDLAPLAAVRDVGWRRLLRPVQRGLHDQGAAGIRGPVHGHHLRGLHDSLRLRLRGHRAPGPPGPGAVAGGRLLARRPHHRGWHVCHLQPGEEEQKLAHRRHSKHREGGGPDAQVATRRADDRARLLGAPRPLHPLCSRANGVAHGCPELQCEGVRPPAVSQPFGCHGGQVQGRV
mmetsp:Transcript_62701/g.161356  ORF Transcript_62701/g.161356 Transcript_62701/m.161356 type:complete len:204 (+) Transcript_62701:590-1201(+)